MKKTILAISFCLLIATVNAQEIPERKADRPAMMHKKKHHRGGMDQLKNLNLTEEQKAKFKASNEKFRNQMAELKKNDNITVREWKAKSESIRNAHKEELKNILTADQKAQMKKMKEEGKAKQEDLQKRMADRMKTNLNLTPEQSAKLDASRNEMRAEMTRIRDNKSLTEQQKKEQMMQLHKKQKENLQSILTAEQLEKMKEARKNHGQRGPRDGKKKEI